MYEILQGCRFSHIIGRFSIKFGLYYHKYLVIIQWDALTI
jgi:hypothetical protein